MINLRLNQELGTKLMQLRTLLRSLSKRISRTKCHCRRIKEIPGSRRPRSFFSLGTAAMEKDGKIRFPVMGPLSKIVIESTVQCHLASTIAGFAGWTAVHVDRLALERRLERGRVGSDVEYVQVVERGEKVEQFLHQHHLCHFSSGGANHVERNLFLVYQPNVFKCRDDG